MHVSPAHSSRGRPCAAQRACLTGLILLCLMGFMTGGALAGEEGEPGAKSTPPTRFGVFEDAPPGAFFFDFNDLVPGAPVACDHYAQPVPR